MEEFGDSSLTIHIGRIFGISTDFYPSKVKAAARAGITQGPEPW
jgi:hypothetical protein